MLYTSVLKADIQTSGTVKVEMFTIWIDQSGKTYTSKCESNAHSNSIKVSDLIKVIALNAPVARDGKLVQVIFGRNSMDYSVPFEKDTKGENIMMYLPFAGAVKAHDDWTIEGVVKDSPLFGPLPEMYINLKDGGTIFYNSGFENAFSLTDNTLSWRTEDKWNSWFPIHRFGIETIVGLHGVFMLKLKNTSNPEFYAYVTIEAISDNSDEIKTSVPLLPIRLFWGCVTGDTRIQMAKSSVLKI